MTSGPVETKRLLQLGRNRYVLVSLFFLIWMLFLDNYSYTEQRIVQADIDELETQIRYYQTQIAHDTAQMNRFRNMDYLEKYARETYHVKRPNEEVYLIEFDNPKQTP